MWKKLFFISLIILIISNVYWVYVIVDEAVSYSYLEHSHEELEEDVELLRLILEKKYDLPKLLQTLDSIEYDYDIIEKQEGLYINFGSFEALYGHDSTLIHTKNY